MSQNITLNHLSLSEQFQRAFAAAREERFEDGMESHFSNTLVALISQYGEPALSALGDLILGAAARTEAAEEACRWIGRMNHIETHIIRRQLLEKILLNADYARVRDGAGLGLASMDDPASIPALQQAIEHETNSELQHDLQQVLDQLIETQHERV